MESLLSGQVSLASVSDVIVLTFFFLPVGVLDEVKEVSLFKGT